MDEHPDPQGPLTTEEHAELTRLRGELRVVEQERGVLREEPVMKYAAIAAHVGSHTVALMCRVLGVAPSGYYAWCQQPHSNRGVHYARADYRAVLKQHGVRRSMSRKGNCWDNAVAESFFSSLKLSSRTTRSRATRETSSAT